MFKNVKSALLFVLAIMPAIIFSQEMNKKYTDPKLGEEILYGDCNRQGLKQGDFGRSFSEYYRIYQPDKSIISELKKKKQGVEILIVLGTWCSDSQEQVPKFFKILDKIYFSNKNVRMICVSSDKEAGAVETAGYNIQKVPTFIIYRNGKEIGRIIETPYASLEKDLLMFFNDK